MGIFHSFEAENYVSNIRFKNNKDNKKMVIGLLTNDMILMW